MYKCVCVRVCVREFFYVFVYRCPQPVTMDADHGRARFIKYICIPVTVATSKNLVTVTEHKIMY